MAYTFGGGSSVNDIYTDSTGTVGVDSIVAGESLKLDSNGNLVPVKTKFINSTFRDPAQIVSTSTEIGYYNQDAQLQYGNPVVPDGRSVYPLCYSAGGAYIVLLNADGSSRQGTSNASIANGNTSTYRQFMFWQLGESGDYYIVGVAYKAYHSGGYWQQKVYMLRVKKDGGDISIGSIMPSSSYEDQLASATANSAHFITNSQDTANWHFCRNNTVSLFAAKAISSSTIYRFTANGQANGYLDGNTDYEDLENTTYNYPTDIVKIDDANGIFLVLHQTGATEKTLTKLVVSSTAQITKSTVATIDTSYSAMDSAIDRKEVCMVGSGTGSNNLCFFDHSTSGTKLDVQPCTYNKDTDALTWGTYVLLTNPKGPNGNTPKMNSTPALRSNRSWWTYSPAYKKVYFVGLDTGTGDGIVLDTQNSTLSYANLGDNFPDVISGYINIASSVSGTHLTMTGSNGEPDYLASLHAANVDQANLVTENASAVAQEAGVLGETIDVSLVNGITSDAADLPSTYYLKKNDLFFPYKVYIDGAAKVAPTTTIIKNVQRGTAVISLSIAYIDVTINSVDQTKSTYQVDGGAQYWANAYTTSAPAYIEVMSGTSIRLHVVGTYSSAGAVSWEVVEYV